MSRIRNRLFIGNISYRFEEDVLRSYLLQLFQQYGTVRQVQIPFDKERGIIRGIAFVTMGTSEQADAAMAALNGENLFVSPEDTRPRPMRIDYARPPDEADEDSDYEDDNYSQDYQDENEQPNPSPQ